MTLQNADHWQLDYYNLICYGLTDNTVFQRNSGRGTFEKRRMLKYTSTSVEERYKGNIAGLAQLPTLFVVECNRGYNSTAPAYIARLTNVREEGSQVVFDYSRLNGRLTSLEVFDSITDIESGSWEMGRTHWAVKEGNLIERLFEFWDKRSGEEKPKFWPLVKRDHIAVMMPYSAEFDPVHESIKQACEQVRCATLRVDEIYGPNMVISDVFKTIETGKLVICDITGRNPNVLYEAGIAHARNVDVILLTQNDTDVPFNLGQIRYIKYLPNQEGLEKMKTDLVKSINAGLGNA